MTEQQKLTFSALLQQLERVTAHDRQHFSRRLQRVKKIKNPVTQQAIFRKMEQEIVQARALLALREAARPVIDYPENLPFSQNRQAILQAVRDHQVVIVAGETGCGKTTQLPKICMELGRGIKGLIGHTQPRRLAARTVAARIAEELGCESGGCIGYKVRFSARSSANTLVRLMTDGILLAEIQQDPWLWQYDTLIIDEAHERSLNIDFLLGYLKGLLPRRPDLKLIITSATIDPQRFSRYFNNAPVMEVSGRTYPVEVRWRPRVEEADASDRDQLQAIIDAVDELSQQSPGDILIFMSGEREIRDTAGALSKLDLRHTEILPLYARLSGNEQNRVFQPHTGRRIVLATNVAETSLTVPGIRYVIDPGAARISRYSWRAKVQRLPIEPISQASANQRKGRCGRVAQGICIRLYSEEDFLARAAFTEPEILRSSLACVILRMTALGLGDISAFPFIEPPDRRHIQDGVRLLEELGAIATGKRQGAYQLTPLGQQLSQLPVDPRLARMVLEAQKYGCVREVMIIVAALSIQDPRERPPQKQQASDEKHRRFHDKESDFLTFVNLWNYLSGQQKALSSGQFRRLCRADYLNYCRAREWQDIYTQLRQAVKQLGIAVNSQPAGYREIHQALLAGLLSHIGMKDADRPEYSGARNVRFALFPASALFKKPPKWAMVAELVETRRLWGRIAARIEPEWVEPAAQHLLKRCWSEPHWERGRGAVVALEKVTLYGLPLVNARKVIYSQIDPVMCRELFIRHALVEGDWQTRHPFFHDNLRLTREVEELEHKSRRRDILVDDNTLFEFYHQRIGDEVISARHFDDWWRKTRPGSPDLLNFEKNMLIKAGAQEVSKQDYPDFWRQGNLKLRLSYQFEPGADADGVTVHIPLPLLNQVEESGFEWQIPGLRRALVIALIKSLPGPVRRNFVPAPDYAQACLERITPLAGPLLDSLEQALRGITGVTVNREVWQWGQIPDHLKITFRVEDEKGRKLHEGRDLAALKQRLKVKARETLRAVADEGIEQSGLHSWSFGTLPECWQRNHGGYQVKAWPALVDEGDSVAIKLFDTPALQRQAMWCGLRRLLLLNIPSPLKYLREKLPNKARLALYFHPWGKVTELIDDCIFCGVDRIIFAAGGVVWTEQGFARLRDNVRADINETVLEIAVQVEQILTSVFTINKRLKGPVDMTTALGLSDIRTQLQGLVYRGFVTGNGFNRLGDTLRYLRAIEKRLEKMARDPHQDRARMLKIEQVQQAWRQWLAKLPPARREDDDVREIRWMLEELRVSYFAQQSGTACPVSDKRILRAMARMTL